MFRNPCFKDANYNTDKHFKELILNKQLVNYLNQTPVSESFKSTVLGLLNYDPEERISLEDLDSND